MGARDRDRTKEEERIWELSLQNKRACVLKGVHLELLFSLLQNLFQVLLFKHKNPLFRVSSDKNSGYHSKRFLKGEVGGPYVIGIALELVPGCHRDAI